MIKTHDDGNLDWVQHILFGDYTSISTVSQTYDGGYVIGGRYDWSFIFIARTDSSGELIWEVPEGSFHGACYSIVQTSDSAFILTGKAGSGTYSDILLWKIDPSGEVIWERSFGLQWDDRGYCVIEQDRGSYVVAGFIEEESSDDHIYFFSTDTDGNVLSDVMLGTGYAIDVVETSDGNLIVAANRRNYPYTEQNIHLIKTDELLDVQWETTLTSFIPACVRSIDVIDTPVELYALTGYASEYANPDSWMVYIALADSTQILWEMTFDGTDASYGSAVLYTGEALTIAGSGNLYDPTGNEALFLMRTDSLFGSSQGSSGNPLELVTYPNPFSTECNISFELDFDGYVEIAVFDMIGRIISTPADGFMQAGPNTVRWTGITDDGSHIGQGLYLLRIETSRYVEVTKVVYIK